MVKYYPDTLKKLGNIGNSDKGKIFKECIKNINIKNLDLTEWTKTLNNLLDRFNGKEYEELLSNIDTENVNIQRLNKILEQPNYFNIKSEEDIENYQEIKEKVCDKIVEGNQEELIEYSLINEMPEDDKLKFAVLEKLTGYDLNQAKDISNKFLCADEVKANDIKDIKSWIYSLKEIAYQKSTAVLKKLYSLKPVPEELQDKSILEQEAKSLYMQEYNETLFQPEQAQEISGQEIDEYLPEGVDKSKYKFIDAGIEFNMIMTAIGAYNYSGNIDYAKSWNRKITGTKGFSCSYIGNDMLLTAPVRDVCYGFSKMENDSLLMSGSKNLGSAANKNELVANELMVDYQRPQNLKESTVEHNEMVFNRIQNGERKQPDYLLVFKKNNKIQHMDCTIRAVDDFKRMGLDLPIVIVDVDKCIENELSKKQAVSKEETNNNIINESLYETSYEQTGVEERKKEVSRIVAIQKEIMKANETREVDTNER